MSLEHLSRSGSTSTSEEFERMFGKTNLEIADSPEEFLRAVDFTVLNEILARIARRSGSTKEFAPLRPDDFTFIESKLVASDELSRVVEVGGHDYRSGKTTIAWKRHEKLAHANLVALANLIHESVHRIAAPEESDTNYLSADDPDNLFPGHITPSIKRGYIEVQKKTETSGIKRNVSLDEAVTESIALEAKNEYLRRTGDSKLLDSEGGQKVNASYVYDRILLNLLIDAIARRLEEADGVKVDRDEVWQGFVQGYFDQQVKTHELLDAVYQELLSSNPLVVNASLRLEGVDSIDERKDHAETFSRLAGSEFQRKKLKEAIDRAVNALNPSVIGDALRLR